MEQRTKQNRVGPLDLLPLAVALGALAGLLHAAALSLRHDVLGQTTFSGRDVVWMAPITYLAIMLLVAIPGMLFTALVRRPPWSGGAIFLMVFVAMFGILLDATAVHPWALLVLAGGIAARMTASVVADATLWRSRLWKSAAALLVVAVAAGSSKFAVQSYRETQVSADVAAPGAPNVLILILDTVRAASMSLYGYDVPTTPHLEKFAPGGAVFDYAMATAPWTLPSHASIFTGHWPGQLSVGWESSLDDQQATLAEVLSKQGYATGGFVANVWYASYQSGLGRGFAHYEAYRHTLKQTFWSTTLTQTQLVRNAVTTRRLPTGWLNPERWAFRPHDQAFDRKWAPEVTNEFLDWQATLGSQPWFAFLNYFDAHDPYVPPGRWRTRFAADPSEQQAYDAGIAMLDADLARLFGRLSKRGVLDNTIVVVLSDHGEQFGEHNLKGHGNSLYLPVLHVPLIIRFPPKVRTGVRISTPVSLRDLGATIFELLGLPADSFPGRSFANLMQGAPGDSVRPVPALAEVEADPSKTKKDRAMPTARGSMRAVFQNQWHLIINGDGVEELYDYWRDPEEKHNLAGSAEFAEILQELRRHRQSYP